MDDRTFDKSNALEWISAIECKASQLRDGDIYPKLKNWINQISPSMILDIGAGQGVCSDKIDLDGRNYFGLEASTFLVERANELYRQKNRQFILGNVYAMPFSDSRFEAVFSVAVWHLLEDLHKAAHELSRVLKTGGHFLIITASPHAYPAWTDRYVDSKLEGRRFEGKLSHESVICDVLYLHPLNEILQSLQAARLDVQSTETFRNFILIRGRKN